MRRSFITAAAFAVALAGVVAIGFRPQTAAAQSKKEVSVAAVPGEIGGQDLFGAYEVVPDWPKPISALPGNEKWTWGAGQGVFAESPDRVFILERGELPNLPRPKQIKLDMLGPNIEFPIGRQPSGPSGNSRWQAG